MDVHPTKNGIYRYWPIPIWLKKVNNHKNIKKHKKHPFKWPENDMSSTSWPSWDDPKKRLGPSGFEILSFLDVAGPPRAEWIGQKHGEKQMEKHVTCWIYPGVLEGFWRDLELDFWKMMMPSLSDLLSETIKILRTWTARTATLCRSFFGVQQSRSAEIH